MTERQIISITTTYFKKKRTVVLKVNDFCLVDPLNPKKKKHRGRSCVITGFEEEYMPNNAIVRFPETNRIGKVSVSDLVVKNQA